MASTKIINVSKDDKFEEILDLFRSASAKEVIFVLPKKSRSFKNEGHFVILENEAKKHGKKVSLLCSNPEINQLAKKYKFDVLLAKESDEKLDKEESVVYEEEEYEKEEELEPEPIKPTLKPAHNTRTAAMFKKGDDDGNEYQVVNVAKIRRGLEGIIQHDGRPLKIQPKTERPITLEVRRKIGRQPIDDLKDVWRDQTESIWTGINSRTKKTFRNFPKKSLIGLGVISVILLGAIIYVSTGSAKVDITPRKQPLDVQLNVSASDKFSLVDAGFNKIPGQMFNIEKQANQTYPATGEKEVAQKARGKITVYNEYGTTPQGLIATTRFQTTDGLIFRTLKNVIVPGTTVSNGKITPGSIVVEVIADKPGQSYNIPASKFTIPAFQEHNDPGKFEKIYGKSIEAMKGGAVGKAKVVTDVDFNAALEALRGQVTRDIEDNLKMQAAGLKVINSSEIKLNDPESTAKVDEAADEFMMAVGGSIKTVGFKEEDLRGLIKQYIEKTKNLTVVSDKLNLTYDNIVFDETSNTLSFTVHITGNAYVKIDGEKIKTDLSGKNAQEIKDYIRGVPGVESAKVVLSPFWVRRVPSDKESTKLQVNY